MTRNTTIILSVAAVLGLVLFLSLYGMPHARNGCSQNRHMHHMSHKDHAQHQQHQKGTGGHATKGAHQHKLIHSYARLRKALAGDKWKAAKSASLLLANQAVATAKARKGKPHQSLKQLASAANAVAKSKDIAAARLAFGQTSKHLIAYLVAHPKHAAGVTVYQCPMAKGYQKWVQWKSSMGNPYMGKSMLKCGGKTKLVP